jgi:hypothetical protein
MDMETLERIWKFLISIGPLAAIGIVLLVAGAVIIAIVSVHKLHENKESQNLRKGLIDEIDAIRSQINGPWLKRDLRIELDLAEETVVPSNYTRAVFSARFLLDVYEDTDFEFKTQVEVSRRYRQGVKAILNIYDHATGNPTIQAIEFVLDPTTEARGMERLYKRTIPLKGGQSYDFVWRTEPYALDLPYSEFWATGHPVLGMEVAIDTGNIPKLSINAASYRPSSSVVPASTTEGTKFSYNAPGPFLPYQGLFIHVERMPQ